MADFNPTTLKARIAQRVNEGVITRLVETDPDTGEVLHAYDDEVAAALNVPRVSGPKPGSWVTEVVVYRLLGPFAGEAYLQALAGAKDFAALDGVNPVLRKVVGRVLGWIEQAAGVGDGIDVGQPVTQQTLAALPAAFQAANYLTGQALADFTAANNALIAYGTKTYTDGEDLFGPGFVVTANHVGRARNEG